MSSGGRGDRWDALTGGPERRQREMLRRLEELDRLDAEAASSDTVAWPADLPVPEGARTWSAVRGTATPPVPDVPSAALRRRRFLTGLLAMVTALALFLLVPRISSWVQDQMAGPPAPIPHAATSAAGRMLPPVTDADVAAASQYSLMQTQPDGSGQPVTWSPCRPIHYVVRDGHGAGDAGRQAVTDAVALVSEATGLAFVDDGDTTETPRDTRRIVQPRYGGGYAPVLVAWSDPTETPRLAGRTVGVGGGSWLDDPSGRRTYVSGQIRLDTPQLLDDLGSRSGRAYASAVVAHELAHVVGAGHSEADNQLMAEAGHGPAHLGRGDRYVLSVLGQGPCAAGL